jgi:nitrite reductase (NO-forming)
MNKRIGDAGRTVSLAGKAPSTRRETWAGSAPAISRRSLLAGSAGLTLGSVALAGGARGQETRIELAQHGPHGGGSLSQRAYPVDMGAAGVVDIAHDPTDLPPPITRREAATVRVDLETIEIEARLTEGAAYRFWTFNGSVPGPFVRVRVGDTVEVHLRNHPDSWMYHNVDFHAVNGPGGGAELTTAAPGEEKAFRFKALHTGLFVYHCAVPPVAMHISNGMYGMILVEPEAGLPPVDREFYVMQGEIYTTEPFGSAGLLSEDYQKLLDERPEYFVLNGHVGALTDHYPLKARVGERVRIFFGAGGPNFGSSFHVIGEVFDTVYFNGSLNNPLQANVHTVPVASGGTVITEMKLDVPGRYVLVDHSLSRVERGLAGWLDVEGEENPEIFAAIA